MLETEHKSGPFSVVIVKLSAKKMFTTSLVNVMLESIYKAFALR